MALRQGTARLPIDQYRRRRVELDQAKGELRANGEIVDITPPAEVAGDLAQVQAGWDALRQRMEAAAVRHGEAEQAALEQQFYTGEIDVLGFRQRTKEREAHTATAVAAVPERTVGIAWKAMYQVAWQSAEEAAGKVWAQVLTHSKQQLQQAQRAQDAHEKESTHA